MKRRDFLIYSGLGATGVIVASCRNQPPPEVQKPQTLFGAPEKPKLTLGLTPVINCLPLVIALEKGFFTKYGLEVTLSKQGDWQGIVDGLLGGKFDAAQTPYGMPLLSQLGKKESPMVGLIVLQRNGSALTLSKKAWDKDIRPIRDYINFEEFTYAYRKYLRSAPKTTFALESNASLEHYLLRYWLSSMNINPDTEIAYNRFSASMMSDKLKAGLTGGYFVAEPWNYRSVFLKAGFTCCVGKEIWQGHPGHILTTMQPWLDKYPKTARAMVAAIVEACEYADRPENRPELALVLAQTKYLNLPLGYMEASLIGPYNYGNLDGLSRTKTVKDFYIFSDQVTPYLKTPDNANYMWQSHGIWLLTQMIRWNHINRYEYPKNADELIDRIYPIKIYQEVAQALKIPLPKDRKKIEPTTAFIDQRKFDPSQPVAYLNQFDIRANRNQIFGLA